MPNFATLALFIPTMFFISITPGMCMTLAMTLGLKIGLRRTMWMMLGEVFGVALVAVSAVLVAIIMLSEFICMLIYATGGKGLKTLLNKGNNIRWMNGISGTLLIGVGVWLALS